eukprot:1569338-Rhodomonas_salina.1
MEPSSGMRSHVSFTPFARASEGVNSRVFIRPQQGATDDNGIMYKVLRPLYGIPSSARALHLTLSKWFKEQGFSTA